MLRPSAWLRKFFRSRGLLFFIGLLISLTIIITVKHRDQPIDLLLFEPFDEFDNETGVSYFIVPNIIHLIRFNQSEFTFIDYLCLQAAFLHHRPDKFYIHTNVADGLFTGKYWQLIQQDIELFSRIVIRHLEPPSEIFGQPLSGKWKYFHGGDIARIQTMIKFGGIYLDNDVFVIKNLDKYRKFEIAMNWDEGEFLGSQVIIAHGNARFLSRWLDTYHDYHPDKW